MIKKGEFTMKKMRKRMLPLLTGLLLFALCMIFGTAKAEASQYTYFKGPKAKASYTVGTKIPISFYCGVVITETKCDAWGRPVETIYQKMPATLRVFKGNQEIHSVNFTYTKATTIATTYTPTTTGTLKLCLYAQGMGLNAPNGLQDTVTITVKKAKPATVKSRKPVISVERTGKKVAQISCSNNYGFGMKVYRATKKKGKYKLIKTTSKSVFKDKKLAANKEYYYKVRLYAKKGKKTLLSKWSAPVKAAKYDSRTISLSYTAGKGVKISWKKINGAGYYLVGRNNSGTGKEYEIISCEGAETTTYYDKDVTKGKTYYYCIIAEKGNAEAVGKYMGNQYKITIP